MSVFKIVKPKIETAGRASAVQRAVTPATAGPKSPNAEFSNELQKAIKAAPDAPYSEVFRHVQEMRPDLVKRMALSPRIGHAAVIQEKKLRTEFMNADKTSDIARVVPGYLRKVVDNLPAIWRQRIGICDDDTDDTIRYKIAHHLGSRSSREYHDIFSSLVSAIQGDSGNPAIAQDAAKRLFPALAESAGIQ